MDVAAGFAIIQKQMTDGASLTEFCHQLVEHLRGVMVLQMTQNTALLADLPDDTVQRMQAQAAQLSLDRTLDAVKRFSEAVQQLKGGYQPQLPLELALIETVQDLPAQAALTQPARGAVAKPAAAVQITSVPAAPTPGGESPEPTEAEQLAPLDEAAVEKMRARWEDFLMTVRVQCGHQVQAAMRSVRDVAVSEHLVAFAFGSNTFSRDMVAKPETLSEVAKVLSNLLGRTVKLECQMGDRARVAKPIAVTAAFQEGDEPDPLVEYAVHDLGAEVVEQDEGTI
jgi:DNA polymerase-3 subunit gamma/tau